MSGRYALGIDFGTESGRAVLVDCADGSEVAASVYPYANGVLDERLPDSDVELGRSGRCRIPPTTCAL